MTQEETGQKRQEDISGSSLRKKDLLRLFKVAASCRSCIKVKDGITSLLDNCVLSKKKRARMQFNHVSTMQYICALYKQALVPCPCHFKVSLKIRQILQ